MKRIIISHKNCPDGCASVVITKKIYPDVLYALCHHQAVDEIALKKAKEIEENGLYIITDIMCSQETLGQVVEELVRKRATLWIFDHHKSQEWLNNYPFPPQLQRVITLNMEQCASKLLFDHLIQSHEEIEPYRRFLEVVNDRDLWINKTTEGLTLSKMHNIYGDVDFIKRYCKNPSLELTEKEKIILEYQTGKDRKKIEHLMNKIEIGKDANDRMYGIIFGEGNSSDLLNAAIEKYDLEYAILINLNNKSASIRGRGQFDCNEFAKKYGGGGHKNASGFRVNFDFRLF